MMRDKKGRQIGNVSVEKVSLPEKPSWLGSKEGITDKLLPPWTPIETRRQRDTLIVKPWGRSYRFEGLPFPTQIEMKGASILRRPIEVRTKVDGKSVIWTKGSLWLRKKTQASVSFSQRLSGAGLTLFSRTQVEYDGMVRVEWELKPLRMLGQAKPLGEFGLITETLSGADVETLRRIALTAVSKNPSLIILLGGALEKAYIVGATGQRATDKDINMKEMIIEAASVIHGSGGGTSKIAQAGGPEKGKLDEALNRCREKVTLRVTKEK